jgi:Zn finger protein HypA/HybF involved in hydrogenase expression
MYDKECPKCHQPIPKVSTAKVTCRKCGSILVDCPRGSHTVVEDAEIKAHGHCRDCWEELQRIMP